MNIKSLLIGSAAALAAVSGAQAADAIVAAEPEAVEYVRVCDAFGTGFFYIPGTETCLKIGGYVRVQLDIGRGTSEFSDYDVFARGRLNIDARNDTELGTLTSFIQFRANASKNRDGVYDEANYFELEQAYIDLAGVRVGKFYSWWDDDLLGETDELSTNSLFASARYVYSTDAFTAGLSVDELPTTHDANVGIAGYLAGAFGPVKANLLGAYDTDAEEFAVRGIVSADVGPGTFELAAAYASGDNAYYAVSEWTVAADYAFKATDKLTITPAAQYFWDYNLVSGNDAWKVGLTAEYQIVSGLTALATVNYIDFDKGGDDTSGFLRLQRNF
ncbi:porin [Allorhizobium borbori]|uniref:Porin n=1 Tax=Allorhizobium borbori TaxID=485907 RepID=A0A7W6K000_9HYPH|nr:porin [Allorhizobium borbori]MBB4102613.1 hypothetical protein [Allorhizobium borbori]PZU22315.1 MAG: hypothetical protein DI589_10445 [Shinella sp.]